MFPHQRLKLFFPLTQITALMSLFTFSHRVHDLAEIHKEHLWSSIQHFSLLLLSVRAQSHSNPSACSFLPLHSSWYHSLPL